MKTRHLHRLLQGTAECDSAVESLILILEAAVERVSIPGNDFCWSYWADEFKALSSLPVYSRTGLQTSASGPPSAKNHPLERTAFGQ